VRRDKIQRDRAGKILASLKERFGEKFICEIDHDSKLVFATDIDTRTLEELRSRCRSTPAPSGNRCSTTASTST